MLPQDTPKKEDKAEDSEEEVTAGIAGVSVSGGEAAAPAPFTFNPAPKGQSPFAAGGMAAPAAPMFSFPTSGAPAGGAARQSSATQGGGGGAGASTHKAGLAGAQEAALHAGCEACKAAGLGPSSCREKAPSRDPAVEALHSLAQVWPRRRGMPLGCALSHWWPA